MMRNPEHEINPPLSFLRRTCVNLSPLCQVITGGGTASASQVRSMLPPSRTHKFCISPSPPSISGRSAGKVYEQEAKLTKIVIKQTLEKKPIKNSFLFYTYPNQLQVLLTQQNFR